MSFTTLPSSPLSLKTGDTQEAQGVSLRSSRDYLPKSLYDVRYYVPTLKSRGTAPVDKHFTSSSCETRDSGIVNMSTPLHLTAVMGIFIS